MRHLERTHAKALEHTRAASEAQTANELVKQKEQLQHQIGKELEASLAKREAELYRARRELDELRGCVSRRDEELANLQGGLFANLLRLQFEESDLVSSDRSSDLL